MLRDDVQAMAGRVNRALWAAPRVDEILAA
jgi:hypothetical protein